MRYHIFDHLGGYLRTIICNDNLIKSQLLADEFAHPAGDEFRDDFFYFNLATGCIEYVNSPPDNINYRFDVGLKKWIDCRSFLDLKNKKWSDIKNCRENDLMVPLVTKYGIFDANDKAQKSITDAVLMLQTLAAMGTPITIDFTLANNSVVTLTTDQLVSVGLLIGQRTQAIYEKARLKREAIDLATSADALDAITW